MKPTEQGFSQDQNQSLVKTRQDADQSFLVDNYGGINTTSPTVNLPFSDSPDMLNMKVSLAGTLSKRYGSVIRGTQSNSGLGSFMTTFELLSGLILSIVKSSTSLVISLLPEKESFSTQTLIKQFDNVWANSASNIRPSFVWTSEENPRLIMVSGSSVPVELVLTQIPMVGLGTNQVTVSKDYTGEFLQSQTFGIYDNTVLPCTSITSTTFSFSSTIPLGQKFTCVQVCWHWWSESLKRTSKQVYDSTYRFNTSITSDANVEIPVELRRGLEADDVTLRALLPYGYKPLVVLSNNAASPTELTFDSTPSGASEFAYSSRVFTVGAGNDTITPGTAYLTFGGISGVGLDPPTPLHLVRLIWLPFNGGTYIEPNELNLTTSSGLLMSWRDNVLRAANTTSNQYYWLQDDALDIETTGSSDIRILRFDGGYPFGISDEFVEISNALPGAFVGSAAVSTYYSPKVPGSFRPWYGASVYANYLTGVFPSVIGLFQDRLVLSGFSSSPLVVLLSNSRDNGSRYYYQNFQVDFDDTSLSYNPVEILLDGLTDDSVTQVMPWLTSLFVLTKNTVRRIHGGQALAITPTNRFQNTISSVGCVSRHGVVRTDSSVYFISKSGFYSIDILSEGSEYGVNNVGLKVEKVFKINDESGLQSWCFYNQLDDEIWVGLSDGDSFITNKLYLLFPKRNAWSEYSLTTGYLPSVFGCSDTRRSFVLIIGRDTSITEAPTSSSKVLSTEFNVRSALVDLIEELSDSTLTTGYTTNVFHTRVQYTVDESQRKFSTLPRNAPSGYSNHGFRVIPLANYEDNILVRKFNGVSWQTLTYANNDFSFITQRSGITLSVLPYYNGDLVEITLLNDNGEPPLHVFRDKLEMGSSDYTIVEDGDYLRVTVLESTTSAQYYVGSTIPCWHFTPTFFRSLPPSLKRGVHYIGYYDNTDYTDLFISSDTNVLSGQDGIELADKPVHPVHIHTGILFNDAKQGIVEQEVYGASELTWDVSLFDFASEVSRNQLNDVVRISIPLVGIGYSFQFVNFNYDVGRFTIVGYQGLTRQKGRNSVYWY